MKTFLDWLSENNTLNSDNVLDDDEAEEYLRKRFNLDPSHVFYDDELDDLKKRINITGHSDFNVNITPGVKNQQVPPVSGVSSTIISKNPITKFSDQSTVKSKNKPVMSNNNKNAPKWLQK